MVLNTQSYMWDGIGMVGYLLGPTLRAPYGANNGISRTLLRFLVYALAVYRVPVYSLQVCIDFLCIDNRCINYMCIDIVCIDFPE